MGTTLLAKGCFSAANNIFIKSAEAHADTVARDQRRKASEPAKKQRKRPNKHHT